MLGRIALLGLRPMPNRNRNTIPPPAGSRQPARAVVPPPDGEGDVFQAVVDEKAAAGDVLPPLARLLLAMARRAREAGGG
jgi:hypothetical protein